MAHNPNVTPSGYLTKLCGLFGMVGLTYIVHTTQQIFLIGLLAKSDSSHLLRHIL